MTSMQDNSIRLGLMAPLTGLVALYGPEISWAGRIACDEVNENGGILGRPLELIIIDDGSLPATAVPAAERLIDEYGCTAIIGNLLSNSRIAVSTMVSEPRRVPYLNFSFYEGSISGRYFFHFAALPNQQIDKMIPYMDHHFGPKMFFAGSNYEWPRGSISAAKDALIAAGGEIVGEEYLPIGSEDVDDLLSRVGRSGADVFVPYFAGVDQVNLLTRFTELGLKNRMAVVMGHYDEAMVSYLSPQVREGFYSSNTYFMSLDTPQNKKYLRRLAAQPDVTGVWPSGNGMLTNFGEGAYLCVHAFAKAANEAGNLDAESLVKRLETISVSGPQGEVIMDAETHHAQVNSYLSRCNSDGTFSVVEKFGRSLPVIPSMYRKAKNSQIEVVTKKPEIDLPQPAYVLDHAIVPDSDTASIMLELTDAAVISVNQDGIILYINHSGSEIFGYQDGELIGKSLDVLMPPMYRNKHAANIHWFVESEYQTMPMTKRPEISGYRKDGSIFTAEATISKTRAQDGWLLVATLHDISARKAAEKELTWRATHDALTGLPNRTLLLDRLANALARADRQQSGIALLFVDLDNFKLVNDSYGHSRGDQLLVTIANMLIDMVRPGDTVSRFGGDEFVILCEQFSNEEIVYGLAERINQSLRKPMRFDNLQLLITASIGVVHLKGNITVEESLRKADAAMYRAKELGRDGWRVYDNEVNEQSRERLWISSGLHEAIERNELQVRFQPIIDANNEQVIGAEILLRWFPLQGEVSPAKFIPIAEMSGSINSIGRWVFRQACLAEVEWRKRFGADAPYLSVNLSTRQLNDRGVVDYFSAVLSETGSDPSRLVLEITETALMADVENNLAVLQQLATLGLRVAVDDFGTGYSSLSQLLRMPVNSVKIDRVFIDGLGKRRESDTIVSAVINMAHTMGLRVVAEGVETVEQQRLLQQMGCNHLQGFLFYKPMEAEHFLSMVSKNMVA